MNINIKKIITAVHRLPANKLNLKNIILTVLFHAFALLFSFIAIGNFCCKIHTEFEGQRYFISLLCYLALFVIYHSSRQHAFLVFFSIIASIPILIADPIPWPFVILFVAWHQVLAEILLRYKEKKMFMNLAIFMGLLCFFLYINSTLLKPSVLGLTFYGLITPILMFVVWVKTSIKKESTNTARQPVVKNLKQSVPSKKRILIAPQKKPIDQRFSLYQQLLDKIIEEEKKLPNDFHEPITLIGQKAALIIQCMQDDSRDVGSGSQFLQRYLTATKKVVEQCVNLFAFHDDSADCAILMKECEILLWRFAHVFSEKHIHLLENDHQDVEVEMNVMEKLLKMEGYD